MLPPTGVSGRSFFASDPGAPAGQTATTGGSATAGAGAPCVEIGGGAGSAAGAAPLANAITAAISARTITFGRRSAMTVASPAAEATAATRRGEVRRGSRAGRRRSAHPARRRRRSAPAPTTRGRAPQAAAHHRPATPCTTGSTRGRIVVVTKHRWVRAVVRKEWPVPPAESEAQTDRHVRRVRVVGTSDALEALERRAPGDDLPARVHLPVEREATQVHRLIERRGQRVVE